MQIQSIISLFVAATVVNAAVNEPCIGSAGRAGVCVATAACSSSGGTSIAGACPSDPSGITCCTKAPCTGGNNCRWSSDCAGTSLSGQCPGPSSFQCCTTSTLGFGGYPSPSIPAVGACKAVAVSGSQSLTSAFPGRIREIFCTRACTCNATPTSDHCCGKAIDFMCSDGGGVPTISGREIAEWVMNNRASLNLKYVIWGQRIWNVGVDAVGPWTGWRGMDDRGDFTQNHWDHVHVSFN